VVCYIQHLLWIVPDNTSLVGCTTFGLLHIQHLHIHVSWLYNVISRRSRHIQKNCKIHINRHAQLILLHKSDTWVSVLNCFWNTVCMMKGVTEEYSTILLCLLPSMSWSSCISFGLSHEQFWKNSVYLCCNWRILINSDYKRVLLQQCKSLKLRMLETKIFIMTVKWTCLKQIPEKSIWNFIF